VHRPASYDATDSPVEAACQVANARLQACRTLAWIGKRPFRRDPEGRLRLTQNRESMNALPSLLCSDVAAMRLAGFNAVQIRDGRCQRSHEKQQREKHPARSARRRWSTPS